MYPLDGAIHIDVAEPPPPPDKCCVGCMDIPKNFVRNLKAMNLKDYFDILVISAKTVIDLANGPLGQLILRLLSGGIVSTKK